MLYKPQSTVIRAHTNISEGTSNLCIKSTKSETDKKIKIKKKKHKTLCSDLVSQVWEQFTSKYNAELWMITVLFRPLVTIILVSVVHRSLQLSPRNRSAVLGDLHSHSEGLSLAGNLHQQVVYSCDPEDSEKHHITFMSLSVTLCVRNMFETDYYHCSHNFVFL